MEVRVYFADLSPYKHGTNCRATSVVNVGWLDGSMPYSRGAVPSGFAEQLRKWFVKARVRPMRGIHECNFCRVHQWPPLPLDENPSIAVENQTLLLGNWEIWIPGRSEKVYASPALIIHYVEKHEYSPPEEFIEAVMNESALRDWQPNIAVQRLSE